MTSTPDSKQGPSRRLFLAGAAAVPLVAIRTQPARAAEFNYKLATGQSLTQPINARLDQACQRIREASGGRIELKFFPASQLGSDTDLITQVRTGGIEFLNIAGSVISTVASGRRSPMWASPSPTTTTSGAGSTGRWAPMSAPRSRRPA